MKSIFVIIFIILGLIHSTAFSADAKADNPLSPQELELLGTCNREARNALISEDIALVELVCMQAANDIEKTHKDKKYIINPLMNLSFAYSNAGQFEKATPLYERARKICEKAYGSGSKELKKVDKMIKSTEAMKRQRNK